MNDYSTSQKHNSPEYPPWDTLLRIDDFASGHIDGNMPERFERRFFRRFFNRAWIATFQIFFFLVALFVLAVALDQLLNFDTLPLAISLAVAAEVLLKVTERLLGNPSYGNFRTGVANILKDRKVIEWCRSEKKYFPAKGWHTPSPLSIDARSILSALADPFHEIGISLGQAFRTIRNLRH